MTGYTVHTGTSKKFSDGWDRIFGQPEKETKTQSKAGKKSADKAKSSAQKKKKQ